MVRKIRRGQRQGSNLLASGDGAGTVRPSSIDTAATQSTLERAVVRPKIDLHRERGVLGRAVQIASTSEPDMAADRLQGGAAAEVERAVSFDGAIGRFGERGQA